MELYNGPLDTKEIFCRWLDEEAESNYGAYIPFVGTIRAEDDIEALSFDIYEPVLKAWFEAWQERAAKRGAVVKMAHSIGDVPVHTSSYISAVFSPKRRVALELIDESHRPRRRRLRTDPGRKIRDPAVNPRPAPRPTARQTRGPA